jgi:hypothetical protein
LLTPTEPSKATLPWSQTRVFKMVENMAIPGNSMDMGSLPQFICYEVISLIRSNAVWTILTVKMHYISEWIVFLLRILYAKKTNPYPE